MIEILVSRFRWTSAISVMVASLVATVVIVPAMGMNAHAAAPVTQVSTSDSATCAIKESRALCWGSNSYGKLGNNKTSGTQTTPVYVADNKSMIPADPGVCSSRNWFGGCDSYSRQPADAKPASALGGKRVQKISTGTTHTCALADARVYCWGDNSHGQLGDRTTNNSASPVAVDTQSNDIAATSTTPNPCGAWWIGQPSCTPVTMPAKPKSAIANKEIVDISAGNLFTCALASDNTIACWGEGDNGRLGIEATVPSAWKDSTYPQAVYKRVGSALWDKKAVKLTRTSGATMCVIAADSNQSTASGRPYCWGHGVGDGIVPPSKYLKCGSGVGTSNANLNTTSAPVYFDAAQPRDSSGSISLLNKGDTADIAETDIITAIANNAKPYYWGLHGYILTTKTAKVGSTATPARTGTNCSKTTTTTSGGGNVNAHTGKPCGGGGGGGHGSPGCGGGGGSTTVTVTYYDVQYTYTPIGSATAVGPLYDGQPNGGAFNQKSLSMASGNALDGLFCAKSDGSFYCDTHGTSASSGQTGSNYTQSCRYTYGILDIFKLFPQLNCDPQPVGPQKVQSAGWLDGKTVTQISTSPSGYTCVIADGSVGCWGANVSGQLGTGDTNSRNVPTPVQSL